jgi:hypothetical protein
MGRSSFEANLGRKVSKTLISSNKPKVVVSACNPSYVGGIGRRITVRG